MAFRPTPAANSPDPLTSSPIDANLRAALTLLRHAHDRAHDADAGLWDFALEIGGLEEAGLTFTDLRWLVAKGFAEHGSETSVYGDEHRSFMRSDGLNFLAMTCVILTEKGAAFAGAVLQAAASSHATRASAVADGNAAPTCEVPEGDETAQRKETLKPRWDAARRELSLGGRIIKLFRVPAKSQELILSVFQEEGWPEGIEDPLPGNGKSDRKTRLNDAIYRLNRTQIIGLIHFHSNGDGNGVHWELCEPKINR